MRALAANTNMLHDSVENDPDLSGPYALYDELRDGEELPNTLLTKDTLEVSINTMSRQARERFLNAALIK